MVYTDNAIIGSSFSKTTALLCQTQVVMQIRDGCTIRSKLVSAWHNLCCNNWSSYLHPVTIASVVSGMLSVIATSLIASCIMWCVVLRRRQKRKDTPPGVQQREQQPMTPSTEFVEYEVPVFNKQEIQSITTQDNVAYTGNISLEQNVAYEQVHRHQH